MASIRRTLLWLLVVVLGIEIGAGLYEARVLVPLWAGSLPESLVTYNTQGLKPTPGRQFWMVSTPLVGLLGLANLLVAWRSGSPQRAWWMAGAAGVVLVVAITFVYFVPTLMGFERVRQGGDATLVASVQQWVNLNWVRAAVYVASWFCLLHAYRHQGRPRA